MSRSSRIQYGFVLLASLMLSACSGASPASQNTSIQSTNNTPVTEPVDIESERLRLETDGEKKIEALEHANQTALEILGRDLRNAVKRDTDDPSQLLTNVIVDLMEITVVEESENGCTVDIKYPNVVNILNEIVSQYPEDTSAETLPEIYQEAINQLIRNEGDENRLSDRIKIVYETRENGEKGIVWSDELANAMTGGILNAYEEVNLP